MSDNFKITKNNIKEILESMHDQIETALTECGMDAESYAKKECPVDTGRLRNSITFSTEVGESEAVLNGRANSEGCTTMAHPNMLKLLWNH